MAITNQERVGKAMDLLRARLAPFVEREAQAAVKAGSLRMDAIRRFADDPLFVAKPIGEWVAAGLLKLASDTWNDVFRKTLGFAERALVQEQRWLRKVGQELTGLKWVPPCRQARNADGVGCRTGNSVLNPRVRRIFAYVIVFP